MDKIRRRREAHRSNFAKGRRAQSQNGHTALWPIDNFKYTLSMIDSSILFPVSLRPTQDLLRMIDSEIKGKHSEYHKARALFDWMEQHINYDHDKPHNTYRTAQEVLLLEKGVCGEMAYLYIGMSRLAGMISRYVEVDRDVHGKKVSHACAVVYPDGREIFVDPAYHQFDIRHQSYKIIDDREMFKHFLDMRQEDPFGAPPPEKKGVKKGFLEWLLEE